MKSKRPKHVFCKVHLIRITDTIRAAFGSTQEYAHVNTVGTGRVVMRCRCPERRW